MIELQHLTKIYGQGENRVVALDDVSYRLDGGGMTAIVGKSGSGKSTMLNLIGALESPTSGKVWIDGEDLFARSQDALAEYRNRKLGYIFQSFYLEPEFTVLENVAMPLLIAGVKKQIREQISNEYIDRLGLSDKRKERVKNLSGGQRQRVAIARALVSDPQIILADEPTGNLDSANGQEVMRLLRAIADSGKTVLLVTHNMQDAMLADRRIELQDGKIVSET